MAGIICCITNNKGGVGKTSLTCNLGTALSLQNKKVLIVDNDAQANTTGVLLNSGNPIRNSLYELLDPEPTDTPIPIENCIHPTKHKGLYCLPNVDETSGLEMDLVKLHPQSSFFLRNAIREYAQNNFDITLIDCSPTLGLFVANALYASDFAIVPIDAGSAYSLDGLRKVLDLISAIQGNGNPDLKFLKLLINRVDKRTAVSKAIISDIEERFPEQVFNNMIPTDTACQKAEYIKQTLFTYAPTSRGSKAYRLLAKEVISLLSN